MCSPLSARISPVASVRLGMGLFIVAVSSIMFNLWAGWMLPFIGIAQGLASTWAIRTLLNSTGIEERAGLLASHFPFEIALAYALLGIVAAVVAMTTIKNSSRAHHESASCQNGW